ncbi:uncharacterized protein LOC128161248 [Crassostrea angulata]|uniref:uncharacterized protein LOC128161248 n=1 Tax=Magallana angulata TaxID=2784310 RepID=UPI0005C3C7CB|nr:uncharacterized protein LOC128161248 [Crassostrea angulata]|eukprot:XP_011436967.1 PREDICTED: uncharacterized protein LOC105335005 [Crassostrea gigas]
MKVVLILSVLWVCVENVYTCTCVDIPTNGCNSDYSILGTVIGVIPLGTPPNDARIYNVLVNRIYKANRPLLPLVRIRAYVGGSLCGLLLDRGRQYVISGSFDNDNGTMRTNHCLYTRLLTEIPFRERWNLYCYNQRRESYPQRKIQAR